MARPVFFLRTVCALASAMLLAACGNVGAPLPPSLQLPERVQDLRAERKGQRVLLTFTVPAETTDRTPLRRLGVTRICRTLGDSAACTPVAALQPAEVGADRRISVEDRLPETRAGGFAAYAVEVLNDRGRSAGLSAPVQVPLEPTLPPPANLRAEVSEAAILLRWDAPAPLAADSAAYGYRVFRHAKGAKSEVPLGEVPGNATGFADRGFEWEQEYTYRVTPITRLANAPEEAAEISGEDAPPITVAARDTFAPATPSGVQAVFTAATPGFIDLTWTPNNEEDLAGYLVYRAEVTAANCEQALGAAPGEYRKLTPATVPAPSYRDNAIAPGRVYLYSVNAVDLRGNQGARSEAGCELAPQATP